MMVELRDSWVYYTWCPQTCIAFIVAYLLVVKIALPAYMKDREPMQLRNAMRVYNFAQVATCGYMCYGLWSNPLVNPFRLNTDFNATTEYFIFIHYLSKGLDFFDTVFMTLRKNERQITTLHVFHHASIPLVWSILLYLNSGYGTVGLGAFANSFIHVLMYSHYFVTSFGIKNPFKKVITQAQLMQFSILIVHSLVALFWERKIPRELCLLQTAYQITMLSMFFSFYKKIYTKKSNVVEEEKAAAEGKKVK
jgi:hypothetical protein